MDIQQSHIEWNLIILAPAVVFVLLLFFIVYIISAYRRSQLIHKREKEGMKKEFGAEIDRARLEMSELTLQRIAKELHDNIGQSLTLAKMKMPVSSVPAADDARELVNRALNDLRSLSHLLSNHYQLELGLEKAIRRELELLSRSGFKCDLQLVNNEGQFIATHQTIEQEEVIFFRCVQEALSNIVKYAEAKSVKVTLFFISDRCVKIEVSDDGKGFDRSRVSVGIGLQSMEQRMKMLGGKFKIIDNRPGTCLVFSVEQNVRS